MKSAISKETSNTFRGIAAVMIILSHYAEWYSWFVQTEGKMEIYRTALTKLGVYGVDIFFLLSGYAMVISLNNEKMSLGFVWKRIKNVYIPYFIISGVIELISGGFTSFHDFWLFASGNDYWYMNVLFVFYIGFIIIYAIIKSRFIRTACFCIFTYAYSFMLYRNGQYEFWYVSNFAFALGVIAAEAAVSDYKKFDNKISSVIAVVLTAILSLGMFFVIKYGLYGQEVISRFNNEIQVWLKIGASAIWTVLILVIAVKWKIKDMLFAFLGRYSLYLYLTHTYIFMSCINSRLLENTALMAKYALSAAITIVISVLCGLIITRLQKLPSHRL